MIIDDLIEIYNQKKNKFGSEAYRYISNVLAEAGVLNIFS